MIRGSVPGSTNYLVLEVMRKFNRPMKAVEIHAQFHPDLKIRRGSVSVALNELCNKEIAQQTGRRGSMLYSLTGKSLPIRVPVKRYWKSKNKADCANAIASKKKAIQIVETIHLTPEETVPPKKTQSPQAPELIKCNSCEWYGPEKGCPDCRYVLPNEKVAA